MKRFLHLVPNFVRCTQSRAIKIKLPLVVLTASLSINLFAADLVTNGGMTSSATGWSRYPDTTTRITTKTDPALPGPVQLLVLDTRENGMNTITTNAYQKVQLKSNTKYRISFIARSESGTPADMFVRVIRSQPASATTKNIFFDNFQNPTIVTRRVRVSDRNLTPYSIDFETGDLTKQESGRAVEYAIAFSSRSYGTLSYALGGLVGFTFVSLQDQPSAWGSISNLRANNITTLDINQAGYLGANKPFIFTLSNLPPDVYIKRSQLKRMSAYGKVEVVTGLDGNSILASVLTDKSDLESNQRVITLGINTNPAIFPNNLVDDLQSSYNNNPSFGNRHQGYFIEVEFIGYDRQCSSTSSGTRYCWDQPWGAYLNSAPFPISKNVYAKMSSDALKYFTANVAGKSVHGYSMAVDDPAKQEQGRTAGHIESDKIAICRSGKDRFGNDFGNGCTLPLGNLDVSGGWYDAGDQGKYVVNGGISLWTIQNLIERLQKKADAMTAGSAEQQTLVTRIQSLMKISKDEMDFMLRMQAPDGTKAFVPVGYQGTFAYTIDTKTQKPTADGSISNSGYYQTDANIVFGEVHPVKPYASQGSIIFNNGRLPRLALKLALTETDVSGMVFHSVTDENWTRLPTAPANDLERRILSYPTSAATLNMAAVAAQAYRIWSWDKYSSAVTYIDGTSMSAATYADRCLSAAKKAYDAAKTRIANKTSIFRYEYSNDDWSGVDATTNRNAWLVKSGAPLPPQWLGGGAYGDYRIKDEFYWASMELFLSSTAKSNTSTSTDALIAAAYTKYIASLSWGTSDPETKVWSEFKQTHFPILSYDWIKGFEWQNVATLGTLSALTIDANRFVVGKNIADASTTKDVVLTAASSTGTNVALTSPQKNLKSFADTLKSYSDSQAYRFAKQSIKDATSLHNRDFQYEWGSNGNIINRAMILAFAYEILGDKSYADAAVNSMDYILGRNANGYSFVTGYGMNPIKHPHHRFWAKILDPNYPAPIDGVLLGGPNSRDISAILANANHTNAEGSLATIDSVQSKDDKFYLERAVVGKCLGLDASGNETFFAPQKCFIDHPNSFATSEVAINWNAPLAWMTQFLYEYGQQ